MKIHLIRKETIDDYEVAHSGCRTSFREFLSKLKYADWEKPADIKDTFPTADLLGKGCNRVVFDISGNSYRMIAKYAFGERQVHLYICWIGTHAEYTALCKSSQQYATSQY
jgi:mRNA interferase HigB